MKEDTYGNKNRHAKTFVYGTALKCDVGPSALSSDSRAMGNICARCINNMSSQASCGLGCFVCRVCFCVGAHNRVSHMFPSCCARTSSGCV